MGVRFYDEAISNKIKKWVKDENLRILKPDESTRLFEMTADLKKDHVLTLPVIAISRDKNIEILDANKQPKTFTGYDRNIKLDESGKRIPQTKAIPLDVIPIRIGYQIDIYTKGMEEADEYMRNFVFNFVNYPKLAVEIPYNGLNIQHYSNIYLDTNISDNSDIREHLFPDEFVRFTIKLYIDDAYLFSAPVVETPTLELGNLEVVDAITDDVVETEPLTLS